MTIIDYGIIGIILISILIGWQRGFIKEVVKLCIWGIAIWTGWNFNQKFAVFLPASLENPSIRIVIAYSLLVAIVLVLGGIANYFLDRLVKKTGLTSVDRFAGMLLGIVRGMIVVCILVMLAGLTSMSEQEAWQKSSLQPLFQSLVLRLTRVNSA